MEISNGTKKNININLKFSKAGFLAMFKNLSWLFLFVFLVLVAFEAMEVQTSVGLIIQLNQAPPVPQVKRNSVASIDFDTYGKNLQRVESSRNFKVTDGIIYDPFNGIGTPPSGANLGATSTPPFSTSTQAVSSSTPLGGRAGATSTPLR